MSHLNDPGFYQLLDLVHRPFVASHSNARGVCPHPRNLTDDQIRQMVSRRCLIGLNYYTRFLREDGQPELGDLMRHIDHFLALGAENCLALGSDFDGADLPQFLSSPTKAAGLYGELAERYGTALCDQLFYGNTMRFFEENLG